MNIPKFLIVADRGELKLFQFTHHNGRPSNYHLKDSLKIEEAHQRYRERFSDQAGSFPNNSSQGQGAGIAEQHGLATETDHRIFRQLGHQIDAWLKSHDNPAWAFAAPSEINASILKEIQESNRSHLHQNLREDLIHLPTDKLLAHLEAATPSDLI